ncbi:MAG: hypothetical protein BZ138_00760 [Methanosphaera sp. rholeuAM270]|nr:MAG: hypothetical protein BZ138_00760 [Methanosphaera sp. rholeuAM270]
MSGKPFLARKITRIYLETYLVIISLIFFLPVVHMLLVEKNPQFFGANILFFEFNLFLSLVLVIYTYFTRYENRNWKMFLLYFVMCLAYLVGSMLILGGKLYFI